MSRDKKSTHENEKLNSKLIPLEKNKATSLSKKTGIAIFHT
jgi:hypothetical protein